MNRDRTWGIATIGLASLVWGTTGTAATFASGVGPLAIGAAALGIGGLLQAAIALPALRRAGTVLRTRLRTVLIGGWRSASIRWRSTARCTSPASPSGR